jgi:hypothetical protein
MFLSILSCNEAHCIMGDTAGSNTKTEDKSRQIRFIDKSVIFWDVTPCSQVEHTELSSSGLQSEVGVPPGEREDNLFGTWKHLMDYVKLAKNILFRDKGWIIRTRFRLATGDTDVRVFDLEASFLFSLSLSHIYIYIYIYIYIKLCLAKMLFSFINFV